MTRLRTLLVAAAAAFALALQTGPASAVSGSVDSTDTNVGALGVTLADGSGRFVCTGTLLSADQFLTAGHCAAGVAHIEQELPVTGVWVSFDTDLHGQIDANTPALGGYVNLTGVMLYPTTAPPLQFPGFHGGANAGFNDLAIYELDQPVHGITPVTLPEPNALASLRVADRPAITAVGYGSWYQWQTGPGRPPGDPKVWQWDGVRHIGQVSFQGLTSTQLVTNQNASSSLPGGICYGDSGGPLFYPYNNTTKVEVALNVWGDIPCRAIGFAQRLDLPAVLDWINQHKH